MRLLVDECSPNFLVEALRLRGHDVVAAAATDPGDGDPSVLERSVREGRILVTVDRGFGSLVQNKRRRALGVVVVTLAQSKSDLLASAEEVAARIDALGEDLLLGRLTILTPDRTRQRDLPVVADRT